MSTFVPQYLLSIVKEIPSIPIFISCRNPDCQNVNCESTTECQWRFQRPLSQHKSYQWLQPAISLVGSYCTYLHNRGKFHNLRLRRKKIDGQVWTIGRGENLLEAQLGQWVSYSVSILIPVSWFRLELRFVIGASKCWDCELWSFDYNRQIEAQQTLIGESLKFLTFIIIDFQSVIRISSWS